MRKNIIGYSILAMHLFTSLMVSSESSAQSILIKIGQYVGENYEVEVRKTEEPNWYEIRADGSVAGKAQYVLFLFNALTGNVVKSPYGAIGIKHGSKARVREFS